MEPKTLVISDIGGTKGSWAIIRGNDIPVFLQSPGHNFARMGLEEWELPQFDPCPDEMVIHGAGLSPARVPEVVSFLTLRFPGAKISCGSDLDLAAKALLDRENGIVCILGTGSAVGYYENGLMTSRCPSLGYVLGDEGSGTAIAKNFLRHHLRDGHKPIGAQGLVISEEDVIKNIYRGGKAARFLSELCPRILRLAETDPTVGSWVVESFREFARDCLRQFPMEMPVNCVGSIACHFHDFLARGLEMEGRRLGKVIKEPLPTVAERVSSSRRRG